MKKEGSALNLACFELNVEKHKLCLNIRHVEEVKMSSSGLA